MTQNTAPVCVRAIWPRRRERGSAASDDLASTITHPQPNWDGLGWVGPQSKGKAANKCSAYVRNPSRLLEKHSSWSWLRECQECAKLSSRQMVATLKNLKYKIYFDLLNTFLLNTWFHMWYFIVLMCYLSQTYYLTMLVIYEHLNILAMFCYNLHPAQPEEDWPPLIAWFLSRFLPWFWPF